MSLLGDIKYATQKDRNPSLNQGQAQGFWEVLGEAKNQPKSDLNFGLVFGSVPIPTIYIQNPLSVDARQMFFNLFPPPLNSTVL